MARIESYIDGGIGVITLAESSRGNTLYPAFLEESLAHFRKLIKNQDARVLLLRSSGKVFSRGMDLGKLSENEQGFPEIEKGVSLYRDLLDVIFTAPKPVICAVQGEVKAGGVGIVCACDIVLAVPEATFELSEVLFGLIPANVMPYLLENRISVSKARYLILTAKQISAEDANTYGIVDELVPDQKLEKMLKKICKQLLRSSPRALAEVKRFSNDLIRLNIDKRTGAAQEKLLSLIKQGEALEAAEAFQAGGLPEWFSSFRPERPLIIRDIQGD